MEECINENEVFKIVDWQEELVAYFTVLFQTPVSSIEQDIVGLRFDEICEKLNSLHHIKELDAKDGKYKSKKVFIC